MEVKKYDSHFKELNSMYIDSCEFMHCRRQVKKAILNQIELEFLIPTFLKKIVS